MWVLWKHQFKYQNGLCLLGYASLINGGMNLDMEK
jgi:hypothetical protein